VLQGIAFGVLLLSIPLPQGITHLPSFEFLFQQYFYLPYIISSLLILSIWKQFVAACLFATWPLSTLQIGLIYLITLAETMSFRAISVSSSKLSTWLIWIGFVGVFGGCIRLNNLRLEAKEDFEAVDSYKLFLKNNRQDGILYLGSGIVVITFGLLYNLLVDMLKSDTLIAALIPWFVYASLLLTLCLILILDIKYRQSALRLLFKNTDFAVATNGVLRYHQENAVLVDQFGNPIRHNTISLPPRDRSSLLLRPLEHKNVSIKTKKS